jgi:hypothetical protein
MDAPSSASLDSPYYDAFLDLDTALAILAARPPQMMTTPTTNIMIALPLMSAYLLIALSFSFGMPAFKGECHSDN